MASQKKINEMISKALDSSQISPEGSLQPDQADQFIDKTVDEAKFIDMINTRRVDNPSGELSKINMNEPVTYGATEGSAPTSNEASPTFTQIDYTTSKLISWMDITTEVGNLNIEGSWSQFKNTLMNAWKNQISNDHEMLSIMGNESIDVGNSAPNTARTRLLTESDGVLTQLLNQVPAKQQVDWNGEPFSTDIFSQAIATMPTRFAVNRDTYSFLSSYRFEQRLRDYWENRGTDLGDKTASQNANLTPRGIDLNWIPKWPDHNYFEFSDFDNNSNATDMQTYLVLASPDNFDYVVSRDMENYMEFKPRRDSYEGTFYTKVDFLVEDPEAVVLIKNVDISK